MDDDDQWDKNRAEWNKTTNPYKPVDVYRKDELVNEVER